MNRTQQHSSLPVAEDFTVPITLPRAPGFAEAPYQMLAGKLTRLLARNLPTKKLTMRNTRPLVSFTFDDAAATACTAGAALLEQFHARGTFYISGENCGKPSPTGRLATAEQLKALHANGHEIACHTYSHTPVVGIGRQALASDLDRNRFFLQGILGKTPGVNADVADLGVLKSNALEQASIGRQDVLHLIAETVRRNGWLLFASHDVNDVPSQYGVRPELLTFALRSALAAGCRVVSVAQALRSLRGEERNGEAA